MSNPFAAQDADLILRTSDGAHFRIYRRILAEASPFFRDLVSLPQPASETDEVPVVDVDEDEEVTDKVLRLVYPITDPTINSLDEVSTLLRVAVKYELTRAIATLRRFLVSPKYLTEAPTRVYAIACRYEFDEEARLASQYTLRVNVLDCPLSEDLKFITAYQYHRLLDLHRKRSEAAQAVLKIEENVKCLQCSSSHYGAICPPRWWLEFEKLAREELRRRPTSDVIFSIEFLSKAAQTGCQRCAGSILDSFGFLTRLKTQIDELPASI